MTITGFKPEKYRCEIPECDGENPKFEFNNPKGIPEPSKQSIFVTDSTGALNYCKRYPLYSSFAKNHNIKGCALSYFNFTGNPVECNAKLSNVVYEDFSMNTSIVTDFNLFCNEDYKVDIHNYTMFKFLSLLRFI